MHDIPLRGVLLPDGGVGEGSARWVLLLAPSLLEAADRDMYRGKFTRYEMSMV